ncbi:hypothetical protein MRB53_009912 [Persea americana]|uniref:Uncharacterized protein n=1 Tax=Persea americana TaxID=3435 RepID=A0ACC2LQP6_PERAE|nr:hypothetical protein MRB53_009912 [Persea americana]
MSAPWPSMAHPLAKLVWATARRQAFQAQAQEEKWNFSGRKVYVLTVQAQNYPITGFQWHPDVFSNVLSDVLLILYWFRILLCWLQALRD